MFSFEHALLAFTYGRQTYVYGLFPDMIGTVSIDDGVQVKSDLAFIIEDETDTLTF